MPKSLRLSGIQTIGLLTVIAVAAGLLTAAVAAPVVGMAGISAGTAAKTFNNLPVQGLGVLPSVSKIVDAQGQVIAYYYPNNIYRVPVRYADIAPVMINAIVSAEDQRFYKHAALDPIGTLRALMTSGSQGGSDLAQQYVKNALILTATTKAERQQADAPTVARKIRELRIAANVYHAMTRHQLLAAYLNAAYFDHQAIGIDVAAGFYFSKKPKDLTLPEAALLAGMVENPSKYDPIGFPSDALWKRNIVLGLMHSYGYITAAQQRSAQAAPLGLKVSSIPLQTGCYSTRAARLSAAWYCDYVLNVLRADPFYKKAWAELNSVGGMTIRTAMDQKDQVTAQNAVNYVEPHNSSYYNPGHNADTEVLIQPGTGDVRAIAENRVYGNYFKRGQTTVNYAVNEEYGSSAGVQTGSSSKIFTLVTALQQGLQFGFHMKVGGGPSFVGPFSNCGGGYVGPSQFHNAEGGGGNYTLYTGTTASVNLFFVRLEQKVQLCNVVKTAALLGVTRADGGSLLKPDPSLGKYNGLSADNISSFTLGSVYVSPMSMADAYATLAARGIYCKPVAILAITDNTGGRLPVETAGCQRVLSTSVADAANFIFQGVLQSGTAAGRSIGIPAAAKTGTSNGGYYAAFAGWTPRLAAYVSVFNPINPTGAGAMIYPRADYRDSTGALGTPSQMFGDNAPGATWEWTFLHLHLRYKSFVYPSSYWFSGGNYLAPPSPPKKKGKHGPTPTPTPTH